MTKLILRCAYNFTRYLSCSIFRNGWLHGPPTCAQTGCFFQKFLPQELHCSGKQGRVAGELVLQEAEIIYDVGSLCISTMWLFNFFLVKRTLKQELHVKETHGKGNRGEFNHYALLHLQAVLHYTLPPLPLHLLLIIIILLLLLLILLLLLLFKEACSLSWFQNIDRFLIFTSYKIGTGITRL